MISMMRVFRTTVPRSIVATAVLGLALGLTAPSQTAAQDMHEILIGTLGDMPSDEFNCGRKGREECSLNYRFYCVNKPDEINAPASPASGRALYRPIMKLYMPTAVHTGNFPGAASLGSGLAWNLVWDGVKNSDTPSHVGYYAAQSQLVERSEMGNPFTHTCLPVNGQYACFGMLRADKGATVQHTPLGNLNPVGDLSPTPVPLLVRNGDDKLSFVWEQASAQESRDGAPLPIEGYRLYVYPNPVTPPTEADLQESAQAVGDTLSLTTTSLDLPRADGALKGAVTLSAALRLVYSGGVESLYFSANGPATGLAIPDPSATGEMDDAESGADSVSRAIDIETLFLEVRQKKTAQDTDEAMLFATVDLVGEPTGKLLEGTTVRLFIDFNDDGLADAFEEPGEKGTEDITLSAEVRSSGGGPLQARFAGLPGVEAHSRLDRDQARVVFAVPLKQLTGAVSNEVLRASDVGGGQRRILVWVETTRKKDRDRAPNTNDGGAPTVAGEVVKFTF